MQLIKKLIKSMPQRCAAVIVAGGGYTKDEAFYNLEIVVVFINQHPLWTMDYYCMRSMCSLRL